MIECDVSILDGIWILGDGDVRSFLAAALPGHLFYFQTHLTGLGIGSAMTLYDAAQIALGKLVNITLIIGAGNNV